MKRREKEGRRRDGIGKARQAKAPEGSQIRTPTWSL